MEKLCPAASYPAAPIFRAAELMQRCRAVSNSNSCDGISKDFPVGEAALWTVYEYRMSLA